MREHICEIWTRLHRNREGLNQRQNLILDLWTAFLDEHPADFDIMVNKVPDMLTELWYIVS